MSDDEGGDDGRGIRCPNCHCRLCPEVNTLPVRRTYKMGPNRCIRRERQCVHCGQRFRTREEVIEPAR